jgi:hypothetical protein
MELTSLSVDNVNELHFFPDSEIRMLFNFERTLEGGGWENPSMKEGSFVLFCSYELHRTGMLQIDCVLGVFGKLLMTRRGAWA